MPISLEMVAPDETHLDPVCGMTVEPSTAAGSSVYEGKTYYFCHPGCLKKFQHDPKKYLHKSKPDTSHQPALAGAGDYTCPMHPEVVSDHPDSCPLCGMALEPREFTPEEGPNVELE